MISPDLTRNDKSKQKWSGGPITGDNTGVETYGTVFAIAESPKEKGLIWAGSDDGLRARHARRRQELDERDRRRWPALPRVGHGQHHRAVAVRRRHRLRRRRRPSARRHAAVPVQDDRLRQDLEARSHAKLPHDVYLHVVREDPAKRGQLYLGTERGVMFSTDDGATWRRCS